MRRPYRSTGKVPVILQPAEGWKRIPEGHRAEIISFLFFAFMVGLTFFF